MLQESGGYEDYDDNAITRTRRTPEYDFDTEEMKEELKRELGLDDASDEDLSELIKNRTPEVAFPFLIFFLAAVKDILDVADLSGVGAALTTATAAVLGFILFFWCMSKGAGGGTSQAIKKRVIRRMWRRYIMVIAISFIPLLKIIPVESVFVFITYKDDSVLAKLINAKASATTARFKRRYGKGPTLRSINRR